MSTILDAMAYLLIYLFGGLAVLVVAGMLNNWLEWRVKRRSALKNHWRELL
jgi:hypothetical protein